MEVLNPGYQAAMMQTVYLGAFGAATWWWLRSGGAEPWTAAWICGLPALCATLLALTSSAGSIQYALRILACGLFAPILLLFWSSGISQQRPIWPFAAGAVILHAAAFTGFVMWAGSAFTHVTAEPSAVFAGPGMLERRLVSLNFAGAPLEAERGGEGEVRIWFRYAAGEDRSHAVILKVDSARRRILVQERVSADGARPRNSGEANLRAPADLRLDPARPHAARVYGTVAQTTPVDLAKLKAVPVAFDGDRVSVPGSFASGLDEEGMVTLLCAVVTRSGWDWHPVFFDKE